MIVRESLYLVTAGPHRGTPARLVHFKAHGLDALQALHPRPLSFAAAGLGTLLVSIAAALIPARRAASVEPMQALRSE